MNKLSEEFTDGMYIPFEDEPQKQRSLPESHDSLPKSHDSSPESHDSLPESHDSLPGSHDSLPQTPMRVLALDEASEPTAKRKKRMY